MAGRSDGRKERRFSTADDVGLRWEVCDTDVGALAETRAPARRLKTAVP
jgi:hypothetical protein